MVGRQFHCDSGIVLPSPSISSQRDRWSAQRFSVVFAILNEARTIQDEPDSWSVITAEGVKLSLFGSLTSGRVNDPELTSDQVLQVASVDDLMATKLKVIQPRAEAKDDRNIVAMIESGARLLKGPGSARLLQGPTFEPNEALRALTYFGDGDLKNLSRREKKLLVKVALTLSARDIPEMRLISKQRSITDDPPSPKQKPAGDKRKGPGGSAA